MLPSERYRIPEFAGDRSWQYVSWNNILEWFHKHNFHTRLSLFQTFLKNNNVSKKQNIQNKSKKTVEQIEHFEKIKNLEIQKKEDKMVDKKEVKKFHKKPFKKKPYFKKKYVKKAATI